MENKKKIIMVVLSVLVCVMAVGYAVLSQQLNINGTASIDSTWKVEITNIAARDIVGDAVNKAEPSYSATTANFSVGLIQPGDSITYDIEVSNLGTLKAKVDSISVSMDNNDAIIYKTEGLEKGDTLVANEKDTLSVTVTYNPEETSQPTVTLKEITVTINYVQDLGTTNEPSITYDYVIGDVVTFAGSNWYVIKNSSSEEDYVTLLKEKVLTSTELGEYAYNGNDTMPYYWSDTCHYSGSYGYTETDKSGCAGHNDYEGSKVKEYLEGTYINTLGNTNLKEVDGYKIRLIQKEELINNLGYQEEYIVSSTKTVPSENVPSWIYQNFGGNEGYGYWTMTPPPEGSDSKLCVHYGGQVDYNRGNADGVRPVINLLKSSI